MSVLTVYLIFQFVKIFPKLFIYLGLVINGASGRQILRNSDPITRTRMYNQLLKLINERREQKKMIEEKESLRESVVFKKRKINCLEFKTKKGRKATSRVRDQKKKKEE